MGQKKLVRRAESPSKRGIAWPRWTGFRGMTVRDWLEVLVVPLALVLIGFYFTSAQDALQQQIEEDQRAQQAQIEEQRAAAERELAEQRAQDEALQAYLDQMGSLLLERDLRASEEDSEVRTLARARTLTMLGRLDPSRKTAVMQFLVEAQLMQKVDGREPIIGLAGADLRGAGVGISGGLVRGGRLVRTNLSGANLTRADLREAYLPATNLSGANLNLAGLNNAKLFETNLSGANLNTADLTGADLDGANLSGANLSGASLAGANLRRARGVTNEQLEQQAGYLEGATMPDGQKYEDWLKSKDRGEDGNDE